MSRKIAITTATGNVGSKVAARLAGEPGVELLLLVRDPARVQDLVDRGARAVATDLGSLDEVLAATQGVDALFWLTPQNFQEEEAIVAGYQRYGRIAAEAVKTNRIGRVVHQSGFVTDGPIPGGPIIEGLAEVEKLLDAAASNVTHLRAAFFFDNYLDQLDGIRGAGQVYMPVRADTVLPMAATSDIAGVAARELLDASWTGRRTLSILGPADTSFADAARAVGEGIGRSVEHVTVTPAQALDSLTQMGLSLALAQGFVDIFAAADAGAIVPQPARDASSTTPTKLSEFARTVIGPALSAAEAA